MTYYGDPESIAVKIFVYKYININVFWFKWILYCQGQFRQPCFKRDVEKLSRVHRKNRKTI